MQRLIISVVFCLLLASCVTNRSYRRIPDRYTTLEWSPDVESYLIEIVPAFSKSSAVRFDFRNDGGHMRVTTVDIGMSGIKSKREYSGETATRLLGVFRGYDWSAGEDAPPSDGTVRMNPDDTVIMLQARVSRVHKEVDVGYHDSASIRALLKELEIEKLPKPLLPTPPSVTTPAAGAPIAPLPGAVGR
jgi:hypothetical protein